MKLLLACEHFYPDGGGVAKYMQELALGLVQSGHLVEVITSYSKTRSDLPFKNISVKSFKCFGNLVNGLHGEIEEYQKYLLSSDADLFIVMAAQQWSFDALFSIIDKIKMKMINIPCGYSYLGRPEYDNYYNDMKKILPFFSASIFHSEKYKDINFARTLNLKNIEVIPMGVNLEEFDSIERINIKDQLNIPINKKIILNVGAPAINKGQLELVRAFNQMKNTDELVLVLNSNYNKLKLSHHESTFSYFQYLIKEVIKIFFDKSVFNIYIEKFLGSLKGKQVVLCDLNRVGVINLFKQSFIFVFPSHIEYSPNVIFEAMAAGLPFMTNPSGNAEEIINWTNAGVLIKNVNIRNDFIMANVNSLSLQLQNFIQDRKKLNEFSSKGEIAIRSQFNWNNIIARFDDIISKL